MPEATEVSAPISEPMLEFQVSGIQLALQTRLRFWSLDPEVNGFPVILSASKVAMSQSNVVSRIMWGGTSVNWHIGYILGRKLVPISTCFQ